MTGRVRVLVYLRAPTDGPDAIEAAYHRICKDLAGTPGLLGNELLSRADGTGRLAVMSEWESMPAFREWETGASHKGTTGPLRPYADPELGFGIYQVVAAY